MSWAYQTALHAVGITAENSRRRLSGLPALCTQRAISDFLVAQPNVHNHAPKNSTTLEHYLFHRPPSNLSPADQDLLRLGMIPATGLSPI